MTPRDAVLAEIDRAIPDAARRVPASDDDLAEMRSVTALNDQLEALYQTTGELSGEQFNLFEPALFIDVNAFKEDFGELAPLTWFGADYASGFFAVDTSDLIGMGPGKVFRADRADLAADALVPAGDNLADFLKRMYDGELPGHGPTLGDRAASRMIAWVDALPPNIEHGPPLDDAAFFEARQQRGVFVPLPLGELLKRANGLLLSDQRQIWPFERMHMIADGGAVAIGEDAKLGTLAVTLGGWQDLPADRMFAFAAGQLPEQGRLLGRTADVIALWIEEAAR